MDQCILRHFKLDAFNCQRTRHGTGKLAFVNKPIVSNTVQIENAGIGTDARVDAMGSRRYGRAVNAAGEICHDRDVRCELAA